MWSSQTNKDLKLYESIWVLILQTLFPLTTHLFPSESEISV